MGIRELRARHEAEFARFWEAYPRRIDRARAYDEFAILVDADGGAEEIIRKAASYSRNVDPKNLQYVPSPAKWLRDRRFEDEDLFTDAFTSTRDWLANAYRNGDVAAIERKYGFIFPDPPIPPGVDPEKFYQDAKRVWIGKVGRHVLHGDPLDEE